MTDHVTFTKSAQEADRALSEIDGRIDWLTFLTPTNLDEVADGLSAKRLSHNARTFLPRRAIGL